MAIAFPLRNPNPFVYPASTSPGFDAKHPASLNCKFSGIASNADIINLFTGSAGTIAGAPAASIGGNLGPGVSYTGSTDESVFSFPTTAFTAWTFGAIVKVTSFLSSGAMVMITNNNAANAEGMFFAITTGTFSVWSGSTSISSTFIPSLNVPYFCAASFSSAAPVDFVLTNLNTGQIRSATIANSTAVTVGSGGLYIGNRGTTRPLNGLLAAAMLSNSRVPLNSLLMWAADPWSFWYPRSNQYFVGVTSAAFNSFWADNNNVVIGTGVY